MSAIFEETQDIIPEISFRILLIVLVATAVFSAICAALDIIAYWALGIIVAVFAAITAVTYCVKIVIRIEDGRISVKMLKEYAVPLDYVIDVKKGDIDIMRNYSGWGIKKVKFKNFTAPGIDGAVSVKLMGRTILTVTTERPDELYGILYEHRRKD